MLSGQTEVDCAQLAEAELRLSPVDQVPLPFPTYIQPKAQPAAQGHHH